MVQKGLGWLLQETAKFDASTRALSDEDPGTNAAVVLRTACETLPMTTKRTILSE